MVRQSQVVIVTENNGNIIGWNQGAENVLLYPATDVIGKPLTDMLPPPHTEMSLHQIVEKVSKTGEHSCTVHLLTKQGGPVRLAFCLSPLNYTAGAPNAGVIWCGRYDDPISANNSGGMHDRDLLNQIIDLNPYGIALWDSDGYFVRANQAFIDIFHGVPPPDYCAWDNPMLDMLGTRGLAAPDRRDKILYHPEMWFCPRDVSPDLPDIRICLSLVWYPVKDNTGRVTYYVCMYENITERKRAEEELKMRMEEEYRRVQEIAGGLAHEIHNALFPARAAVRKIAEQYPPGSTKPNDGFSKRIERLHLALTRATTMTQQVLEYSRLDSEKAIVLSSLKNPVNEVVEAHAARIAELSVDVIVDIPDDLSIGCKSAHIYSLFSNLLLNALDAFEADKGHKIRIEARQVRQNIKIVFVDNGPGIPQQCLHRIFDAFYSTKPSGGTGLGLSMVRRIVDLYNGRILVDSVLNEGSTFTISFPYLAKDIMSEDKNGEVKKRDFDR